MIKNNRNTVYIGGLVLAILLSYFLAFSKTKDVKNEVDQLKTQVIGFEELSNLSSDLNAKERYLDSILEKNNLKNTSVQNSLLDFLNKESSKSSTKIVEFQKPHSNVKDGVNLISYQFTLMGTYEEMEQILYKLEQETGYGNISHVAFEKKRDFRKRKDFLYGKVIVENYDSK